MFNGTHDQNFLAYRKLHRSLWHW